jgi:hypothetical protein
LVGTV